MKHFRKVFLRINRAMGIKPLETVTTKDIMLWQYTALKEMTSNAEKEVK